MCSVCLGIKRSTKLQISKSTPKGDISFLKVPFSRTTTNGSFGLQSCFPVFVISQIVNPAYRNFNGWGGGTLGWGLHVSKSKPLLVFLYNSISDGNQLFSENFGCHFHFILHVMSDKAAFVRGALLCVQCYRETSLSPAPAALPAARELICIYMPPQIVQVCGTMV